MCECNRPVRFRMRSSFGVVMKNVPIEILVFQENGKQVERKYRNLFPNQLLEQMKANYGECLAGKVKSAFNTMNRIDSDMIQIRHEDQRFRVRLAA